MSKAEGGVGAFIEGEVNDSVESRQPLKAPHPHPKFELRRKPPNIW